MVGAMAPTFILCRILGNDLPPRHGTRQTVDSLRFTLDHEPEFPDCEKRWIVNRIADPEREAEILALLGERGRPYIRIPFDRAQYAMRFLDGDGLPAGFDVFKAAFGNVSKRTDVYPFEWIYRHKNLYAINLNVARNLAVAEGIRSGATWVMPWDGQCFLTRTGFDEIRAAAAVEPTPRYLIVPLARLKSNDEILNPDFRPPLLDEPQVIFHRDARDRFDEQLRYAFSNKTEFLARIRGPDVWYERSPWEPPHRPEPLDQGRYVVAGWVGRLAPFSLLEKIESEQKKRAHRFIARFAGVAAHCAELDVQLVREARAANPMPCYASLLERAASDRTVAAAIARHAENCAGIESAATISFPQMLTAVTALALQAEVSGNAADAARAGAIVRGWFVTRVKAPPGGSALDLGDLRHLWALVDALHLLTRAGELRAAERTTISSWFRAVRDRLLQGDHAVGATGRIGIFHDLAMAGAALGCDDVPLLAQTLTRAPLRIHRQLEPGGRQPGEASNRVPLQRALTGLEAMIALAWLGRGCGIDLWRYAGADHRSIPAAASFIALSRPMFADYLPAPTRFDDRIELALRAIPGDAADIESIGFLPRRALYVPQTSDVLTPLWPILLASPQENAAFAEASR